MATTYITERNGGYYVSGTRVSLDSLVYAYLRGDSPESIAASFPAITLEQVFGALAYYAGHREQVDNFLQKGEAEFDRLREEWRRRNPTLHARLADARHRSPRSNA